MARVMTLATIGAVILLMLKIFSVYRSYMKKIEAAKRSGFPYVLSPVFAIGYGYTLLVELIILPLCSVLPFTQKWNWVHMIGRNESYFHRRASHEKFGDTYLIVALNMIYLKTTNAELITQVVTRKSDFVKPIKDYKIVDIFGRSILTSEGQDWRAHKKVVAPSFSEKSNKFAFEESLRQAEAMMNHWSTQGSNTEEDMRVDSTVKDTAILSLHVICAAGFGVPQLWPGDDESTLDGKGLPGLSTTRLANGHQMMFKDSLTQMLHGILNFVILEPWMLKFSPFSYQRSVYRAYDETRRYFNELLDIKKEKVYQGENDKGTMDLMGPMIKASDELPPDYDSKSGTPHKPILSRDEIISNSFIFFFAGHETSANSIHYSIIELAISPPTQQHLQFDIDNILGHKTIAEIEYIADMPRLYNSMVGAVLNEQLRLIPPIINIPKLTVGGDQKVTIDGKEHIIPDDTFIHLNCIGTNRNPRYYPYASSWITGSDCDLDDFVPERWLPSEEDEDEEAQKGEIMDSLEKASFETKNGLFKPVKGSFIAFSEGLRACPGKRFAQVEITAVLTAIFQRYSVELDVADWASDEEVAMMGDTQKKRVYEKAIERARGVLARLEPIVTLMMKAGDKVPVRFVERGKERFAHLFNE